MSCRLYVNQELTVGTSIELPDDQAHYLRSVMRLSVGQSVTLFNGSGGEFHCQIEHLTRQYSSCMVESFENIDREMACKVHLVQAACRSEKIETVLQKATELGAASFQVVRSERSALKLDGAKLNKRLQRWQKIVMEAAEQSARTVVPDIQWHSSVREIRNQGACYLLHPDTDRCWAMQRESLAQAAEITLAIGPEGGWSHRDLECLTHVGFLPLRFGSRIMRTETAGPALIAAVQAIQDA